MNPNAPPPAVHFEAAIFDMDGVVTRTADLHAAAWKELFDAYLIERQKRGEPGFPPFDIKTDYLAYVDGKPILNAWTGKGDTPAKTPLSDRISKDLSKRGFKFVGSTICYAFMQSAGLVNDHLAGCVSR